MGQSNCESSVESIDTMGIRVTPGIGEAAKLIETYQRRPIQCTDFHTWLIGNFRCTLPSWLIVRMNVLLFRFSSMSRLLSLHSNRWVHVIFGLAVSGFCLWFATRELLADPEAFSKAGNAFADANYWTLLPIMVATGVFYWLKALRWRLLLAPIGQFKTGRDLFPFVMMGFGLNNVLPVHMGEVVRVLLFAKHARLKVSAVASSVVLERIFDSISVLTLLSVGLVFVDGLNPTVQTNTSIVAMCVGFLVLTLLTYVFCFHLCIRVIDSVLSPLLPRHWLEKLKHLLEAGVSGLAAIKQPRLLAGIVCISLCSWMINGFVIHLALLSFGLPNSLLISCIVLGLTAIGAAVPSAPGYVGVIQLCFTMVLSVFSDDYPGIFAASVYYHLTEYVLVTLTGIYFLNTTGKSLTHQSLDFPFVRHQSATEPSNGLTHE